MNIQNNIYPKKNLKFFLKCDDYHGKKVDIGVTMVTEPDLHIPSRESLMYARATYRLKFWSLSLWILITGCLVMTGCTHYSTSTRGLPGHIRTIAIPLFQNVTAEAGVKEELTDAIINRFIADNQLKVVDVRDADSIVTGTIIDVREESISFEQTASTRETRIWIFAFIRYEDMHERKVIWEEQRMQAWGVFDVTIGTEEERQRGIEEAVGKMADDILNKTIAGW